MDLLATNFRVGECLVEPRELRLSRAGELIRLEPRVLQVLVALAKRPGTTVTRDELLAEAWEGLIVTDDAINRAVWKLRVALSADPKLDSPIETVPRRGYRLLHAVSLVAETDSDSMPAQPPPAASAVRPAWTSALIRRTGAIAGLLLLGVILVWRWPEVDETAPVVPQLRTLSNLPWSETLPSFAPDGQRLVFSARSEIGEQLWIQGVQEKTARQLTRGAGFDRSAVWSTGGERIVFVRRNGQQCTVNSIAVSGGEPRALTDCRADSWPTISLSPDGKQLVLSDRPDPSSNGQALYLVDLSTGERRMLTDPPLGQGDVRPAWSPDGRWIAFLRMQVRQGRELLRISASGGAPEPLGVPAGQLQSLAWRDAERLLYVQREHGETSLWQYQSGRPPLPLGVSRFGTGGLAVAPDGKVAAIATSYTPNAIWRYPAAAGDGAVQKLLQSSRVDREPRYSPTGPQFAFISTRSGTRGLWLANIDGSGARELWSSPDSEVIAFDWAPDGQRMVFERSTGGVSTICVLNLDGQVSCPVREPGSAILPSWSRDGAWLYFSTMSANTWVLCRIHPDGSERQQLSDEGFYAAVESADGTRLLLAKLGSNGLWSRDARTGEIRLLIAEFPASRPRAFTTDQSGLYYVNAENHLKYSDFSSDKTRLLHTLPGYFPPLTLSLSPDGRALLISIDEIETGDIELLSNLDQLAPR